MSFLAYDENVSPRIYLVLVHLSVKYQTGARPFIDNWPEWSRGELHIGDRDSRQDGG